MFYGLTVLSHLAAMVACLGAVSNLKSQVIFSPADVSPTEASAFLRFNNDPLASRNGSFSQFKLPHSSDGLTDYLCWIPAPREITLGQHSKLPSHPTSNEPELVRKALAKIESTFSRDECLFLYMPGGSYWTYAFCYMDKIIQFHLDEAHFRETKEHKAVEPDQVYVLGRFRGAPRKSSSMENDAKSLTNSLAPQDFTIFDEISDMASVPQGVTQRFLLHTITDGGICELIRKPRTIDIIYSCDPHYLKSPRVSSVQEILFCRYQMYITVPQLCQLEEFVPLVSQDEITTINCRKISLGQAADDASHAEPESVRDFFFLAPTPQIAFPLGQQPRINMRDFMVYPLGFGLYRIVDVRNDTSDWANRLRLVLNTPFNSTRELAAEIKQTLLRTLHTKFPSPNFVPQSLRPWALAWADSFIMWFEVYDYFGDFQSLVRVERYGADPLGQLDVVAVDPVTMKDPDGHSVPLGHFEANGGIWNFEHYESSEDRAKAVLSEQAVESAQGKATDELLASIAAKLGYQSTDAVLDSIDEILNRFNDLEIEDLELQPILNQNDIPVAGSGEEPGPFTSIEQTEKDEVVEHTTQGEVAPLDKPTSNSKEESDYENIIPKEADTPASRSKSGSSAMLSTSSTLVSNIQPNSTNTPTGTSSMAHDEL